MLVKNLIGAELDYFVAKALKMDVIFAASHAQVCRRTTDNDEKLYGWFEPQLLWADGGKIFNDLIFSGFAIEPAPPDGFLCQNYNCEGIPYNGKWSQPTIYAYGETPLIAAMRALVASVFGDEVESIKED